MYNGQSNALKSYQGINKQEADLIGLIGLAINGEILLQITSSLLVHGPGDSLCMGTAISRVTIQNARDPCSGMDLHNDSWPATRGRYVRGGVVFMSRLNGYQSCR